MTTDCMCLLTTCDLLYSGSRRHLAVELRKMASSWPDRGAVGVLGLLASSLFLI